jgi:hypothetical protein
MASSVVMPLKGSIELLVVAVWQLAMSSEAFLGQVLLTELKGRPEAQTAQT